jgi:hypothetical protein
MDLSGHRLSLPYPHPSRPLQSLRIKPRASADGLSYFRGVNVDRGLADFPHVSSYIVHGTPVKV